MNNDFFSKLPEETKEKLKNCKSKEQAWKILKEDMVPITDEDLDFISGGKFYSWKGDSRNIVTEQMAKDFEEGRITGADFF